MLTGVHNHQTLSSIATATEQDGPPTSADTSHSITAEDSTSSELHHEVQDKDKSPSQRHNEKQSSLYLTGQSLTDHPKETSEGVGHTTQPLSSQQPQTEYPPQHASTCKDPSLPSVSMVSSDPSSFQQEEASSKPRPFPASQLNSYRANTVAPSTVSVPFGEQESSEESFDSTSTMASERTPERKSPLFQHVAPSTAAVASVPDTGQHSKSPDVHITDVTATDLQDLTSSTSKNTGSSSSSDGVLRPPVKGILKHPADKTTPSGAPSIPSSKGKLFTDK